MKRSKNVEKIVSIMEGEKKLTEETESKISKAKEELKEVSDKLEETYSSGNFEQGERLVSVKTELEGRIRYLEDFIAKRKNQPLIDKEEAEEIKKSLYEDLYKTMVSDKKRFESILPELEKMAKDGLESVRETQNLGKDLNKLMKKENPFFKIDNRLSALYEILNEFVVNYNSYSKGKIESYKPE